MTARKVILGAAATLAVGALTLITPSTPAHADPQSCANLVPTINGNMGTVMSTFQPMPTRILALTLAVNTMADCLGQPHPTHSCSVSNSNDVLPSAIAYLGTVAGMGTAFSRLGLAFPAPQVNGDVFFFYSNLAFYVNEIGSCIN